MGVHCNEHFCAREKANAVNFATTQLVSYTCIVADCTEAHRALELLEEYHSRLTHPHDRPLRLAIERIMRIFKSRLFQALVGQ